MEYVSGNIFIREMRFEKAGDVVDGHEHNFDHTTYIAHGSLRVEKLDADGGVIQSIEKSAKDGHNWVLIKAGVIHRITALEDSSIGHCIYSHRSPQSTDVSLVYEGWERAYQ
jgi:quercetin dioxygenase-like cupin family protein